MRASFKFLIAGLVAMAGMPLPATADSLSVILYPGYGAGGVFVVEGRLVESGYQENPESNEGAAGNLWNNLQSFIAESHGGRRVRLAAADGRWTARSDDDGFFAVSSHLPENSPDGWLPMKATARGATSEGELLMVPEQNSLGLISDVDDTVMVSEVGDMTALLANTLLKNPRQRKAVPGMADLYRRTMARNPRPDAAPVFYLSASPRQLHGYLETFLQEKAFPKGVLITKKVGIETTGDPLLDQRAYKIARIEEIFARLPQVRFVLVGDDGERDPEIYAEIRARHPDRVADIWIRRLGQNEGRKRIDGQKDIADVLRDGPGLE